ncbi:MAG: hypothetical protein PWQ28_367 [Candidatus Woesearchaeota archaeon]|nr:hypothetical protein [Candidatus Woesearchaeota archaeon]MDK2908330.1 hypothetical protein [Candidatus Woesearchaeota archaeon]
MNNKNKNKILKSTCFILGMIFVLFSFEIVVAQTVDSEANNQNDSVEINKPMYEIRIVEEENIITADETAIFKVEVTSKNNLEDTLNVQLGMNNLWFSNILPTRVEFNGLDFEGKETKSFEVQLKPVRFLESGIYSIELRFESENYDFQDRIIFHVYYNVIPMNRSYETLLKIVDVDYPENLDPRNPLRIEVKLSNYFPSIETDLVLRAKSSLFDISEKFDIGSREQKTIVLEKKLDDKTSPQIISFDVFIEKNNSVVVKQTNNPLKIEGYEDFQKSINQTKGFLKTQEYNVYKNNGNDIYRTTIRIPVKWFNRPFISTNQEGYTIKDSDGKFIAFTIELEPSEEYTLIVTYNYRGLFFICIFIGVAIILYFIFRSPIIVRKKAHILTTMEGGIRDLKVMVSIRNRSHREIRDVEITEIVPKIAEINLDMPVGTLSPSKVIRNDKKGTLVKWDIEKMDKLEERVISFVIKSKLSILGSLRLKPTYVAFTDWNKRKRVKSKELLVRV